MKKLSVEEYAKLVDVSTKTVYRRIERGQLITCKDTVNNKEVTRVIVDDNEILSSDMTNTCQEQMTDDVMTHGKNDDYIDISSVTIEQKDRYLELIKQMYEDNKSLAELAGQTKLLTDSEYKTKEEYFRVIQENAILKAKIETLQEKLKNTDEKQNKLSNWLKRL